MLLTLSTIAIGVAVTLSATTASARSQEVKQGAPRSEDTSLLSGPRVHSEDVPTLVQQDAMGHLLRIEGRPDEAALRRLVLDAETRDRALALIAQRTDAMRDSLIDNLDLLKSATDASRGGDTAKAKELHDELLDSLDPGHERDPLLRPLADILTVEQLTELKRMSDEYWTAWILAEQRARKNDDSRAVERMLIAELIREEVRLTYEYSLKPYQERLNRIYELVDPTPEQREQLRGAVLQYIKDTRLQPTPEQRAALARSIYKILDDEQRVKVFEAALFRA